MPIAAAQAGDTQAQGTGAAVQRELPAATAAVRDDAPAVSHGDSPVGNADRLALRLESITLDMHLNAATGAVTTRARVRVRNGGASPMQRVALQVSSALLWQSARLVDARGSGTRLPVQQYRVTTDTDHTGAANELVLALPKPLAPGGAADLDLYYGGTLAANAERLIRLGAPEERAAAADWDDVAGSFVGLRGFGDVLWFPVSAPAALLADGDGFAHAVSAERQRTAATTIALSLTLEQRGTGLMEAWFLDRPAELVSSLRRRETAAAGKDAASSSQDAAVASTQVPAGDASASGDEAEASGDPEQTEIVRAQWDAMPLDGRPVSLFASGGAAAVPTGADGGPGQLRMGGSDTAVQESYAAAADKVRPLLKQWLPLHGAEPLTVLALPSPGAQAFADGELLVAPVHATETASLAESLVYPLAAAALPAEAPPWVREGVPEFLRLLYLEQTTGHDRMLAELGQIMPSLQQAEAARGMEPAPLRSCVDPVCAREKAAYVLVMLRGMVGDAALQQALQTMLVPPATEDATNLAATLDGVDGDTSSGRAMTRRFEAALMQSSHKDLRWFFADWFNADRGLPDLQIVQVAPRRIERGAATVTEPTVRGPRLGPLGTEPQADADDPRRNSPTAASRNTAGLPDGSYLVAVEVENNGDAAVEVPVTVRSAGLQNQLPLRVPAHGRATVRVPFETTPEDVWVNDGTAPEQHGLTHHRAIEVTTAPTR